MDVKVIQKPWGSEKIWAHTEHYVGKILTVNAGEALSIQYHNEKDETMYVLSGMGMIKFYGLDQDLPIPIVTKIHLVHAGESVHIPPKQIHNVEAISNMIILEASTNHLDDLVRLQDRYNRG